MTHESLFCISGAFSIMPVWPCYSPSRILSNNKAIYNNGSTRWSFRILQDDHLNAQGSFNGGTFCSLAELFSIPVTTKNSVLGFSGSGNHHSFYIFIHWTPDVLLPIASMSTEWCGTSRLCRNWMRHINMKWNMLRHRI